MNNNFSIKFFTVNVLFISILLSTIPGQAESTTTTPSTTPTETSAAPADTTAPADTKATSTTSTTTETTTETTTSASKDTKATTVKPSDKTSTLTAASAVAQSAALGSGGITAQAASIKVDQTSGSANLPIHIDTPPGRAGIEPNINIVYSSGNKQLGLLGVGWNLDLGSIQISLKKGVPKYDSSDTYEMSGVKLVYDAAAGYYRPEIEGSFSKIEKSGNYWVVTDKKGTKYYYGNTDDSRQYDPANSSRIFKWSLNKVIDIFGNAMNVYYRKDSGQVYPDHIYYTALEGANASFLTSTTPGIVTFEYAATYMPSVSYLTGFEVKTALKLTGIKSSIAPNTVVSSYHFNYTPSAATARDLLTSVSVNTEYGTFVPTITFTYNSNVKGFTQTSNWNTAYPDLTEILYSRYIDDSVRLMDLNADGYTDALFNMGPCDGSVPAGKYSYINDKVSSVIFSTTTWKTTGQQGFVDICPSFDRDNGYAFVDIDGDGYVDYIRNHYDGGYYLLSRLNNKVDGFVDNAAWALPYEAMTNYVVSGTTYPGAANFADVNGDGYADIVIGRNQHYASHSIFINNKAAGGTGWTKSTTWTTPAEVDFTQGWRLVDLNGDGLPDLFFSTGGTRTVYMNTGSSWLAAPTSPWIGMPIAPDFRTNKAQFVDLNGDGLTDLVYKDGSLNVLINMGNGWSNETGAWAMNANVDFTNLGSQFWDVNGDGGIDYTIRVGGQTKYTYLNNLQQTDTLVKVDNGVGVFADIVYDASTHYTNQLLPFAFPVVKTLTVSGTANDKTFSYTTNYSYAGGLWDSVDREFRGFNKVTTTDPDGNYSIAYFYQDHFRKGAPYLTETHAADGTMLSKSENAVSLNPVVGTTVQFPYLVRSDNYLYGATGTLVQRSAQVMTYDMTNGNVSKKVQYGAIDLATPALSSIADPTVVTSIDNNVLTTNISYVPQAAASFMTLPNLTTLQDKAGNFIKKTWFYYDNNVSNTASFSNGLLTKKEDWNGDTNPKITTTYAYDVIGNLSSTTDANNNTTTIVYDSLYKMFPIQTTNALGQMVKTYYYMINASALSSDPQYNASMWGPFGSVMAVVDANNQKVFKHYDMLGRVLKVISPLDTFAIPTVENSYAYGANYYKVTSKSLVTSGVAATIDAVSYSDGLGRVIQTKSPSATAGQYIVGDQKTYNSRGLVQYVFPPRFTTNNLNTLDATPADTQPHVTNYYDALGRQIKAVNNDGTYSNVVFDGLTTTTYDPNGHKTVSISDSFGRLITRQEYTGADGRDTRYPTSTFTLYASTGYQYDALGNLTKVTDAKGNITNVAYDTLGRKKNMDDVDMHHWDYTYDGSGNLLTQKDAKLSQLNFTYDALNRLKTKTQTVSAVTTSLATYTYDSVQSSYSIGRLSSVTYGTDSTQFYYDQLGRETSSTKVINGNYYSVSRQYDDLNRLTKLTYPDYNNVGYTYNSAGQANGVNVLNQQGGVQNAIISNVVYNAMGQITSIAYGNGVTTQNTYDPVSFRLTRILTQNASANKLQDLTYTYDSLGNILTITDAVNTGTQSFTYDALNRLLTATGAGYGTKSYAYDQIGNITLKDGLTYTYGANGAGPHAVTSTSDGNNYTYDANGNMVGKTTSRGVWTYVYDTQNRLTSIGYAPNLKQAKTIATYSYDGDGGRTKKTVYRYADTDYQNSDTYGILITQLGAPAYGQSTYITSTTTYVGNIYEIEDSRTTKNLFLGSTRVAAITGTEIDYYHNDHLGSANVISDSTGTARSLSEYDPFGKISRFEKYGTKIKNGWYFFNSKAFDDESGLYYYGGRYYDPKLARFLTADTIVGYPSDPQSLNRYSYCHNNPVNLIDPDGHFAWFAALIFIAKAAAVVAKVATVVSLATTAAGLITQNSTLLQIGKISGFVALGSGLMSAGISAGVKAAASAAVKTAANVDLGTVVIDAGRASGAAQAAANASYAYTAGQVLEEALKTAMVSVASVGASIGAAVGTNLIQPAVNTLTQPGWNTGTFWAHAEQGRATLADGVGLGLDALWAVGGAAGAVEVGVGAFSGRVSTFYQYYGPQSNAASQWVTRARYSLDVAMQKLSAPTQWTAMREVKVPWNKFVSGGRPVLPQFGKTGGGWEYKLDGFGDWGKYAGDAFKQLIYGYR